MNKHRIKFYLVLMIMIPLLTVAMNNTNGVTAVAIVDDETQAFYKAKCGLCHGPAAAKFYDPEMAMEEQVQVILKGKKGEKPPFMPAFEDKGVDAVKALQLAEYMKALRTPQTD